MFYLSNGVSKAQPAKAYISARYLTLFFSRNNHLIFMKTDHFVPIAKLWVPAKGTKHVPE